MSWSDLLGLLARACADQQDERRVLLALPDASYHVREVLPQGSGEPSLLGFIVYRDDPDTSRRTAETSLLFVRPEQVLRVLVHGYDGASEGRLGFPE